MKKIKVLIISSTFLLFFSGCSSTYLSQSTQENNIEISQGSNRFITYMTSTKDGADYCNGVDMDSNGYKKTIVKEGVSDIPVSGLSIEDIAKKTALLVIDGQLHEQLEQGNFVVKDGVVKVPNVEGFSGMSIALCTAVPLVEVNILRIPGIKQVIWDGVMPQLK